MQRKTEYLQSAIRLTKPRFRELDALVDLNPVSEAFCAIDTLLVTVLRVLVVAGALSNPWRVSRRSKNAPGWMGCCLEGSIEVEGGGRMEGLRAGGARICGVMAAVDGAAVMYCAAVDLRPALAREPPQPAFESLPVFLVYFIPSGGSGVAMAAGGKV